MKTKTNPIKKLLTILSITCAVALSFCLGFSANSPQQYQPVANTYHSYNIQSSAPILEDDQLDVTVYAASPILTEILDNLTGGISTVGQAIGTGISDSVRAIFIEGTGETETLSTAGVIITVFGGVALSLGLVYLVVHFLFNLGGGRL